MALLKKVLLVAVCSFMVYGFCTPFERICWQNGARFSGNRLLFAYFMPMKTALKVLSVLLLLAFAAVATVVAPVDTETYENSTYLTEALALIKAQQPTHTSGPLQAGWARVNLSPGFPIPMATSEARKGKNYNRIEDSVWVNAFVFDNGHNRVAWVTADLLIIPMEVTEKLREKFGSIGFNEQQVYMTATHTHSSIGGWQPGYVGGRFAGPYNPQVVEHISEKMIKAIQLADEAKTPASIGYKQDLAEQQVYNRLVGDKGTIDGFLRSVRIQQQAGPVAAIVTYSAHATCLADTFMNVHRDYPGYLTYYLEKHTRVDFAAFAAGAVGSMGPAFENLGTFGQAQQLAADLYYKVLTNWHHLPMTDSVEIEIHQIPVPLHKPNMRLTNSLQIRPWVFKKLFGEYSLYLDYLRLGNIVFVGVPADFSGELVAPLAEAAAQKGHHLIITSFNGGYCGYITHDQWYHMDAYETRTMNWYGPGTGAYFSALIKAMIEQY